MSGTLLLAAVLADLFLLGGKIWTADRANPTAEAVAVIGERIVAVGTNAEMEAWRGPATRIIDARGRRVLPGFNDSHVHLVQGGEQLENLQLKEAASPEEFARRVGQRARSIPKGEWILGGDWDEQLWNPPELPRRDLVDPLTPETPVFVTPYDGHVALANSLALRPAGITRATPDPPNG